MKMLILTILLTSNADASQVILTCDPYTNVCTEIIVPDEG